ncbi:alpha/beta fold hydrolase [Microbispora sp. KK1-11]|uniref:alpha/beta fold hydrolase n=1 Tax=Microbispora sp. KK1-11 TaxID=2053005 RepID=UPI001C8F0297|nr:alpha/beta fold hydrolase [Microbispora sp. KK1-11]
MRTGIAAFVTEQARTAFEREYERAMALWPAPREVYDVDTDVGITRVYRYGAREGEPIVLLHGHGANASTWYALVEALGRRNPVYAVDTIDDPGGSIQTRPVRDISAWLEQVMEGLGLGRVHLVGHSYGGWMALGLGGAGTGRAATLTLLDPGGLLKVPMTFLAYLVAGALAMQAPASWKPHLARVLAEHGLVERPEIMGPVMLGGRWFRPHRPPARPYTDDELRKVSVPTQILVGRRSRLLRPAAALARARRLIPGLRRAEVVPGAGHGLPQERPQLVAERILTFIDGGKAHDA